MVKQLNRHRTFTQEICAWGILLIGFIGILQSDESAARNL